MKKVFVLIVFTLSLFNCSNDVEFNNPAFQGIKDGSIVWKATSYSVVIDESGFLTFTGNDGLDVLTLKAPLVSNTVYVLGNATLAEAKFNDGINSFSTYNIGARGLYNYGDGEIFIELVDHVNNTITGTFRFNAYSTDGLLSVNFTEGVFYKLPFTYSSEPTM